MIQASLFDFSTFPTLTTERLTLREVHLSDMADILVFRGDFEVQKYNGPVMHDAEEIQALIEEVRAEYAAEKGITWAVTLTNRNTGAGTILAP